MNWSPPNAVIHGRRLPAPKAYKNNPAMNISLYVQGKSKILRVTTEDHSISKAVLEFAALFKEKQIENAVC